MSPNNVRFIFDSSHFGNRFSLYKIIIIKIDNIRRNSKAHITANAEAPEDELTSSEIIY